MRGEDPIEMRHVRPPWYERARKVAVETNLAAEFDKILDDTVTSSYEKKIRVASLLGERGEKAVRLKERERFDLRMYEKYGDDPRATRDARLSRRYSDP